MLSGNHFLRADAALQMAAFHNSVKACLMVKVICYIMK